MPNLPRWSDSLSVENPTIDDQHRQLIELCNRVANFTSASAPSAVNKYHGLLDELVTLVDRHFVAEEEILSEKCCPSFASHKAEHDIYRQHLSDMVASGRAGDLLPANLYKLANDYLIRHMEVTDLACKAYLKSCD